MLSLCKSNRYLLEVLAQGYFVAFCAQSRSRVEHGDTNIAIFFRLPLPADNTGPAMNSADLFSAKELCHRVAAQGNDDQRLNGGYLPIKIVVACVNFCGQWIAIIGWPALYYVGDKNIFAFQIDTFQ